VWVCGWVCVCAIQQMFGIVYASDSVSSYRVTHTHEHTILTVIFLVILLSFLYVLAYFSRLVVIITEVVILTLLASFISY